MIQAFTTLAVTQMAAHPWSHGWGWWFPFGFLFWIGLLALASFLIFRVMPSHRPPTPRNTARDILAERFARGEMTSDEYEERLSHLI